MRRSDIDTIYSLHGITFVWNPKKARTNIADHQVSFEQACEAFFDPFLMVEDASRNVEVRDALIGEEALGRLLYVVHIHQEEDRYRIISARKVTPKERRRYESQ
uniref:BrnT family toxin n=1 Tax=Magnetococcus massalia (strain MO-1) TaxID=451514 RepID=A0A1S7LJQ2_MAGMO|nr:Conserved protein of unknown function [Candidatus Magnetococcus massalia]